MQRRRFIQMATLAGATGLAAVETAMAAGERTRVAFHVKGFSCPTCSVGLDTLLMRQKGIAASNSTYPEGKVVVSYDPGRITEETIRGLIAEMGFTVESKQVL